MVATKYVYSIATDFPNHLVNGARLISEISGSAITVAPDHVDTDGDVCDIWMKAALSEGDETLLDGLVAAHSGAPLPNPQVFYGLSSGAYSPDPAGDWPEIPADDEYAVMLDRSGNTTIRGQVLTDENSFRDDFTGEALLAVWSASVIGGGTSHAVANSVLKMSTGETPGSMRFLSREGDFGPISFKCIAKVSQRIVNQFATIGFSNAPTNPRQMANIVFDGTDDTKFTFSTQSSASEVETTVCTLPFGKKSSDFCYYRIEVDFEKCLVACEDIILAVHRGHVPGAYVPLNLGFGVGNTGTPASSTDLEVEMVYFENHDQLQVANHFLGDAFSTRINEEVHGLVGKLTTTATTNDQIIAQYTVPPNRTMYILGYRLSSSNTSVDAAPFKLGKNDIGSIPLAPDGAVDSNFFRSVHMNQEGSLHEDYSACPRRFAKAGDVVKMTVSPNGATSTTWRACLDFVLR